MNRQAMNEDALGRLEAHLGTLLFVGVTAAASLLLIGLVLWAVNANAGLATWLLNGGLIVLMATPILRVIVSVVEYARARDWFFVTTTLAVLTVLLVSIALALRAG
jgi:uncharacterized membrane protein